MRALLNENGPSLTIGYREPAPKPDEALIRPLLAGICATDMEIVKGYMSHAGVMGHEFVGVVEEAKNNTDLVGRRVVGEINISCDKCLLCAEGMENHCRSRTVLGIAGKDGVFADRFTLPIKNLHPVPDGVDDKVAVFAEPLAAAYEIIELAPMTPESRIAILGDGKLGLLIAMAFVHEGFFPVLFGRHPDRLHEAEVRGVNTKPAPTASVLQDSFDFVIEATGSPSGFGAALDLVRPKGAIVLKSTVADPARIDLNRLVIDEITLLGSRCGPFAKALAALEKGDVDVSWLVSEVFDLDDGVLAFAKAGERESIKVLIKI